MYRSCIFCSANLGANDALERFPVGRSIAFDGARGRLWAICPRCARWNLAPIEKRWEAIEDGERLFRDTRIRAQSENVGVVKLRDGTRLIRVGKVLPGEMALVRYGRAYRRRHLAYTAAAVGGGTAGIAAGIVVAPAAAVALAPVALVVQMALVAAYLAPEACIRVADRALAAAAPVVGQMRRLNGMRTLESVPGETPGERIVLTRADLRGARLVPGGESDLAVDLPALDLRLEGWSTRRLIARRLVPLNRAGGDERDLAACVRTIGSLGGPAGYLDRAGKTGMEIGPGTRYHGIQSLALEMALHEETERQALDGELSMLEAMWREAEEIAAIADRLPDHLPPADPPRV